MEHYDPVRAPKPDEWLSLDEQERHLLVEQFHRKAKLKVPNLRLHAIFHVIVENQLAASDPPAVRVTLDRLMREGLSRHDAIHAIGSLAAEHVFDAMHPERSRGDANAVYVAKLQKLSAANWGNG